MKVFISWSGDLSRKIAEVFREWLPGVLQAVKPFFTPNDIEKGARWASEIANELKSSDIGLFVITSENIEKPWIMFEAGAISRQMDASKICVLMFGIDSADLKGPLTQFQATKFEKDDFHKLIRNINKNLGDASLAASVLDEVFEIFWPRLEEKIKKVIDNHGKPAKTGSVRDQREILEEILNLARSIQKNASATGVSTNSGSLRVSPPVLAYKGSMHEMFIDCLSAIAYRIAFDNDGLDVIEPAIADLRLSLQRRPIHPSLKGDVLSSIDEIIDALAAERQRNNEDEGN